MSTIDVESTAVVVRERSSVLLAPVMDVNTALKRLEEFQQFCANYLQESKDGGLDGGDFGAIPGAGKKKVLLKSGADKLCEVYGLYDEYVVISSVENWETGLFDYTLKCVLKSRRDDSMVGAGVGSCSSFESKYRWREQKRACPICGKPTIIKSKNWTTGQPEGYVCWKKDGKSDGCGAKFKDGDKTIEDQIQGRVENPDIIDSKNTVLKMAKKRAKIDAVIGVTRSSGIFTQDLDDLPPVPPSKPPVETTAEDIPLTGAKQHGVAAESKGPANAPAPTPRPAVPDAPLSGAHEPEAVEYIATGLQANFHREFRKCVPDKLKLQADDLCYQWLTTNGFVNEKKEPTAAMIPMSGWTEIRKKACAWVSSL